MAYARHSTPVVEGHEYSVREYFVTKTPDRAIWLLTTGDAIIEVEIRVNKIVTAGLPSKLLRGSRKVFELGPELSFALCSGCVPRSTMCDRGMP